jgi:hypothetical protein
MSVRYLAKAPSYECNAVHTRRAGPTCQLLRGDGVDAAVAAALLEAMQPAQLEISLATLDQLDAQARQLERQWQLRLERARYQADLARRRYGAVDPENRLVARTLERDWNDKLCDVEQLERDFAALPERSLRRLSSEERARILALAQDMPAVWQASTTAHTERKQLLRLLIKDVTLTRDGGIVHIGIRWQTEACTRLSVALPRKIYEVKRTDERVVTRIRELAPPHSDHQIARRLNQEDFASGHGQSFSASKVSWLRYTHKIPSGCPQAPGACPGGQRGDGRYSAKAAAELLNVDVSTIADWCKSGLLDGLQETPHSPRWIRLTPDIITALRKPTRRRWTKRADEPVVVS